MTAEYHMLLIENVSGEKVHVNINHIVYVNYNYSRPEYEELDEPKILGVAIFLSTDPEMIFCCGKQAEILRDKLPTFLVTLDLLP